jgi:phosphoribosylformylglycinamidine synthase
VAKFTVEVRIIPREGLLDPQGKAVEQALHSLSFQGVEGANVGRLVRLRLAAAGPEEARTQADEMCRKLLANPVTEDYVIAVEAG